ncbi:MAG TPA: hypothetical protein VHX88_00760 [Solirubrobacteraceae bacterium]|jgi:hypothetical protein|nr:hypothetical protein [Solirubrobacteraceae bacterium]
MDGGPHEVSARHRVLVLVDEALSDRPRFAWSGGRASWDGEKGYRGWFFEGEGILWGPGEGSPAAEVPDRYRERIDGGACTFCVWFEDGEWRGQAPEGVLDPLLSNEAAAEWVELEHGEAELVLPLANLLDVVANEIPMTPHALAAFARDPDELAGLMDRAAELGLEALPA